MLFALLPAAGSPTSFSMAATTSGSADCRKVVNRLWLSLMGQIYAAAAWETLDHAAVGPSFINP